MSAARARLVVEVDLDSVPGWGHNPEDWVRYLQRTLDETVGHYNPSVEQVV